MRVVDLIRHKRTVVAERADIEAFVAAVTDGSLPDYQTSALLMAICIRGMTADETAALTDAMVRSGVRVSRALCRDARARVRLRFPNAWQYRDYVIRALNADVPYDRFVPEHIAGDLLPKPATRSQDGVNESILGTGFWFLGEEVHSPVDIRQDQADRFDNRIDVMGKTFLGLTIACARCHDHKFDAISTTDYYALYGFTEGARYRKRSSTKSRASPPPWNCRRLARSEGQDRHGSHNASDRTATTAFQKAPRRR